MIGDLPEVTQSKLMASFIEFDVQSQTTSPDECLRQKLVACSYTLVVVT